MNFFPLKLNIRLFIYLLYAKISRQIRTADLTVYYYNRYDLYIQLYDLNISTTKKNRNK